MNKVRADKLREVTNGHDGTWIAHPLINKIAREIFDQYMLGSNQVRFRLCALLHTELSAFCSTMSGARTFVSLLLTCWTRRYLGGLLPRVCVQTSLPSSRMEVHGLVETAAFP